MKKLSTMFAAVAMAAMLTPAISMAQEQQEPAQPQTIALKLPAAGCTSDGFTEVGVAVIVVDADDIAKLGDGDIDAGIAKLPAPGTDVQAALQKAWNAFTAEVASTDLGDKPSDKAIASLKTHLTEFADAETKATGVHFGVAQVGLSAPTEGCQVPAPAPQ